MYGRLLRRLRASRSYGFVLALVLATFVFITAAPAADWTRGVLVLLQALTLAAALWTSGLAWSAAFALFDASTRFGTS